MIRKMIVTLCIITLNLLYLALPVRAAEPPIVPPPVVLIVEINVGTAANASQEFVELYNPTDDAVDMTTWKLQKHALSTDVTTGWQDYALFSAVVAPYSAIIQPGERLLVGTTSYSSAMVPTKSATGALAASGGHLRLIQADLTEVDSIGWDQNHLFANCTEAGAQVTTASFKRRADESGKFIDTSRADDFCLSVQETPGTDDSQLAMAPPIEEPEEELPETPPIEPGQGGEPPADGGISEEPEVTRTYLTITITELLPDPASPQTDAEDEFIELYNPHDESVDLSGYRLQTGTDFTRQYILGQMTLPPNSYVSLRSITTHLSLANSGGSVRLVNPSGVVTSVADAYNSAKPGQSWAFMNGTWQWTAQPTPGAVNSLSVPPVKVTTASVKAAAKKVASNASKPKATATPKAAVAKTPAAPKPAPANEPATITPGKPNYAILIAIGTAVVGYAVFEYRNDIFNKGKQFKDYLSARFGNRGGP